MIKNKITEIIEMTESVLFMKSGSITWSIIGKKFNNEKFVCVAFMYKSKEFINVMAKIDAEYQDSIEMVTHIMNIHDRLLERVVTVLSVYGMTNLIRAVAERDTKLVYMANFDIEDSNYDEMIRFDNPCLN